MIKGKKIYNIFLITLIIGLAIYLFIPSFPPEAKLHIQFAFLGMIVGVFVGFHWKNYIKVVYLVGSFSIFIFYMLIYKGIALDFTDIRDLFIVVFVPIFVSVFIGTMIRFIVILSKKNINKIKCKKKLIDRNL